MLATLPKPLSGVIRSVALFAALGVSASGSAQASVIPAVDFTSNSFTWNSPYTLGYSFDLTAAVDVAGLSVWDEGGDGLVESHEVGLWNASGTLLASVTIDSGTTDPLDTSGHFRYKLLNSVLSLPIANGYRVGALYANASESFAYLVSGVTTAPGISYVGTAYGVGSTLTNPDNDYTNVGYFGGSFVLTGGTLPLPEPGTLSMLLLGGVVGFAKRKQAR